MNSFGGWYQAASNGDCDDCGRNITVGSEIYFDGSARRWWCEECYEEHVEK